MYKHTQKKALKKQNNKEIGSAFENAVLQYLHRQGYWAHFLHPAPDGSQPCDIIAAKEDTTIFIDCKALDGKRFSYKRIEDNQEMAFTQISKKTSHKTYFVIQVDEDNAIFAGGMHLICRKMMGHKSITVKELEELYGITTLKQNDDTECHS